MRSFGERAESLRHCACRAGPALCWYKLCLALLIFPIFGLAQLNHIEMAARLLSQGQMDQAEIEARRPWGIRPLERWLWRCWGRFGWEKGNIKARRAFQPRP